MSNIVEKKYPLDMSPKDIENLERFIESGMPGLYEISPDKISKMITLYFNGDTYHNISAKVGIKKNIVLFIAYKHNFYQEKIEKYEELAKSVSEKLVLVHDRSTDLLLDTMSTLENYYRDILNRYATSKDSRLIESANFENFKMYLKCMEVLQKIKNPENNDKKSSMGLNLPNGGILKKIDDNTVEVSPLNSSVEGKSKLGEILKALADLKEQREK